MPRHTRTKLALQWAVEELINRANSPCGFYLITIPEIMPWDEVVRRHTAMLNLMSLHVARKKIPAFAGVRVFEEGEETHRPHAHWVMTPRLSQRCIQYYANIAGMGHVWLDPKPATVALGSYLGKYMGKGMGAALKGRRKWSCFGAFSSAVKASQVRIESEHTRAFADAMQVAKAKGMTKREAYTFAARAAALQKYGLSPYDFRFNQLPEEIQKYVVEYVTPLEVGLGRVAE